MYIKNTYYSYGIVSITFHWLIALLIISMLALGLYMVDLPIGLTKMKLYRWHKEWGILILGIVLLRLFWRAINVRPRLNIEAWEKLIARLTHHMLYILMVMMPLTGWCMSSAAGLSVSFFGIMVMPDIISPDATLRPIFAKLHQSLAYLLIALIILHVLAALKHHFINRDDVLRRMFYG